MESFHTRGSGPIDPLDWAQCLLDAHRSRVPADYQPALQTPAMVGPARHVYHAHTEPVGPKQQVEVAPARSPDIYAEVVDLRAELGRAQRVISGLQRLISWYEGQVGKIDVPVVEESQPAAPPSRKRPLESKLTPSGRTTEFYRRMQLVLPLKKLRKSCDFCADMKIRCNGDLPTCSNCDKRGLTCNYSERKRPGPKQNFSVDDVDESARQDLAQAVAARQRSESFMPSTPPMNQQVCGQSERHMWGKESYGPFTSVEGQGAVSEEYRGSQTSWEALQRLMKNLVNDDNCQ